MPIEASWTSAVQRDQAPVRRGAPPDRPRAGDRRRAVAGMADTEVRERHRDLAARQLVGDRQAEHRLVDAFGGLAAGQQQLADPEHEVDRPGGDDGVDVVLGRLGRRRSLHEDMPGSPEPVSDPPHPRTSPPGTSTPPFSGRVPVA